MLKNSILSSNDEKIDFLVSEIESANTKISMLESYIRGGLRAEAEQEEKKEAPTENERLKQLLIERTEEANKTILKLAEDAKLKGKKAEECLALVQELSNELLKERTATQKAKQQQAQLEQTVLALVSAFAEGQQAYKAKVS